MAATAAGGGGGEELSVVEQGYKLLDDVTSLLAMLRTDQYDLSQLNELRQRFVALASVIAPVPGEDEQPQEDTPKDPQVEAEKEQLRAALAAKNAEMKKLIDAFRHFQQDFGLLFATADPPSLCTPSATAPNATAAAQAAAATSVKQPQTQPQPQQQHQQQHPTQQQQQAAANARAQTAQPQVKRG